MERKREQTRPKHAKIYTRVGLGRETHRGTSLRKNETLYNRKLPKNTYSGDKK